MVGGRLQVQKWYSEIPTFFKKRVVLRTIYDRSYGKY